MTRLRLLLLVTTLTLPAASRALSLQDLQAGASFSSTGGDLSFEFASGSIALSGTLPVDLSLYTVTPTASGFFVSGPLAAIGPAFGGLAMAYRVTAGSGLALTAASLQASGIAFGSGALAIASSGFSNGASLAVLLSQAGGTGASSNASFTALGVLDALASLQLFALTPGDVAGFGSVQHGFGWIALPEPGSVVLLLAGLVGLGWLGTLGAGSKRARG